MLGDLAAVLGVAIEVQHDLFLRQMVHFVWLVSGSSCCRSFCTARKTLFLAALGFSFKVWLISSIDLPSMCRMVKATRSGGVSRPMACAIFDFTSALSSNRSGPGLVAVNWTSLLLPSKSGSSVI